MVQVAQKFEHFLDVYRRPDGSRWGGQDLHNATGGVVTRSYVTNLRKGRIESPGFEKRRAIAKAMNFPPELWFEDVESLPDVSGSRPSWFVDGEDNLALPRRLKSWMASRTVCEPHPKERAICGARSPLELARSIWHRRRTKASFERNPASNAFRSLVESVRTKMGGFMTLTIAHNPEPILHVH